MPFRPTQQLRGMRSATVIRNNTRNSLFDPVSMTRYKMNLEGEATYASSTAPRTSRSLLAFSAAYPCRDIIMNQSRRDFTMLPSQHTLSILSSQLTNTPDRHTAPLYRTSCDEHRTSDWSSRRGRLVRGHIPGHKILVPTCINVVTSRDRS